MRIELCLLALLVPVASLAAEPSAADKNKAKVEYQKGQKAYDLGDFKTALDGYSEAYRLDARPPFLFNIAQCHRQLNNHERAAFFFQRFLSYYPPGKAPNDKLAHDLLAESEAKLKQKDTPAVAAAPVNDVAPPPPTLVPEPYPGSKAVPPPPVVPAPEPVVTQSDEGGLTTKWWFWTAVGVVAAGAITTGAVLVARPHPRGTTLPDGDFR